MLRLLFVLLLLANLGWAVYSYVLHPADQTEAAPPLREKEIKLLPAAAVAALPVPASAPASAVAVVAPAVCFEWRGVPAKGVADARSQLQALGVSSPVSERQIAPADAKHWVYMPPQTDRAAAEKKISELENLGVTEYHLETAEGKWQWAISLGVFSSEERAGNFLAELRGKGVRSARMGPRDGAATSSILRFSMPDESMMEQLVQARQKFPGSSLKAVACGG